ncbi:MAG TPA: hypothetical protein PLH60_05150 [Proteiniphilum sp.]|nr:hypothetical protein [Proteiniphilum sp.]HPD86094.1 hypothetical protein [Proteiniphilum sp.]HPJ49508.1 hypothetical protein [Proteiniphilum sp.]HPR19930.1 hypothetical protein [Proteiniphilum sp.]
MWSLVLLIKNIPVFTYKRIGSGNWNWGKTWGWDYQMTIVALICAGWDGNGVENPGIPLSCSAT